MSYKLRNIKFEAGVNTVGNELQVVLLSSEYWSVDGVETSDAKVVIVQPAISLPSSPNLKTVSTPDEPELPVNPMIPNFALPSSSVIEPGS